MRHWAFSLIGKPWAPGAVGPASFHCWGVIQWASELRHGVAMPMVSIGTDENVAAIKRAAQASGWRRVDGPPAEDDIVLMRGPYGRHVGWMTYANGMLGVLHADGCMTPTGPRGSVVFQSLSDATAGGYGDYEFWRRA